MVTPLASGSTRIGRRSSPSSGIPSELRTAPALSTRRLPARVYRSPAGVETTRKLSSSESATSSAPPVRIAGPAVRSGAGAPVATKRSDALVAAVAFMRRSRKRHASARKPGVDAFTRLFVDTSSDMICAFAPDAAAQIPELIAHSRKQTACLAACDGAGTLLQGLFCALRDLSVTLLAMQARSFDVPDLESAIAENFLARTALTRRASPC